MALIYDPDDVNSAALPTEEAFNDWIATRAEADEHPADAIERWLQTYEPRAEVVVGEFPRATGCWVNLPDAEGKLWTMIAPRWMRLRAKNVSFG